MLNGQTLGRLATQIASILRGKNKPIFAPNVDAGDYVIVINCEKIVTTGNKLDQKIYYRHSGYPSGLTATPLRQQLQKHPDRVIRDSGQGDAAQERPGPEDAQQAQGLRRRFAPACARRTPKFWNSRRD